MENSTKKIGRPKKYKTTKERRPLSFRATIDQTLVIDEFYPGSRQDFFEAAVKALKKRKKPFI